MSSGNNAQPALAPAPLAAINGGPALLALWLLLTTNKSFLLDPAQASVAADQAANQPIGTTAPNLGFGQNDQIRTWDELAGALVDKLNGGGNGDDASFTTQKLQSFLTSTLFGKTFSNADGSPGDTYASALYKASSIFQVVQDQFVNKWGDVCPPRIGNALNLQN